MKKVFFKIGLFLMFAGLFVGCSGSGGGNPDGNNPLPISIDSCDITTSVNEVILTDGTWKFIDTIYSTSQTECGIFVISNNKGQITYTEGYNYSDGYLVTYGAATLASMSSENTTRFDYDSSTTTNGWILKTNNNTSNLKYSIYKENVRSILVEKID